MPMAAGAEWSAGTPSSMAYKYRWSARYRWDTITVDITDLPETALVEGSLIDLADLHHGVDAIAARAGTIGYEIPPASVSLCPTLLRQRPG